VDVLERMKMTTDFALYEKVEMDSLELVLKSFMFAYKNDWSGYYSKDVWKSFLRKVKKW
jgi:hypothetical protein